MKKFVTTYAEWLWTDGEYRLIVREGYEYDGPWSKAMDTQMTSWDQNHFRWANDDTSSLATVTFAADEDATLVSPTLDTPYHLFLRITNTGGAAGSYGHRIQFDIDGAGYNTLTTTSTGVKYAAAADALFQGDGDSTGTDRLTLVGSSLDTSGDYQESDPGSTNTISAGQDIETAWCVQFVDADLSGGETITFRAVDAAFSDDTADNYNFSPVATIAAAGPSTYPGHLTILGVGGP